MAGAEATRLDALRRAAQIDRADACLALGENEAVMAELTGLVAGDPTDEQLAGRLMLAQYRASGASVALATFDHVRDAIERELAATPDTAAGAESGSRPTPCAASFGRAAASSSPG